MKRELILSVVSRAKEDPQPFLELIKKHRNAKDHFVIAEFFQSLPKKQHSVIWGSLLSLVNDCVTTPPSSNGEEKGVEFGDNHQLSDLPLSLMTGVVDFCAGALSLDDCMTPDPMAETLQVLHDILLNELEVTPDLQNKVSCLLELWWGGEKPKREGLVPHCLLYLVARSLSEGAKVSDVKRVWSMRKAFLLLDFEDPMTSPFKTMLLACTLQKIYLQSEEGRKLLSFLFGMHPSFVENLHQTIKNQIPLSPKPLLEIYAEIYFRAWRLSSGPYLLQIEERCLQDLMYSAVHATRTGQHSLFHALRKILGHIHQQRSQKGVSEMLLRLYSPFLWRSLKVAHPHVRANAASLLLDAFPLQDPTSTKDKIDDIMQKQFDVMTELLGDPSVLVRVTAVSGVCRVLSLYFEMIPFAVMKALVGRLVKELAWDSAAIDVRVTVLQGLCVILENRLSHPLLKELLPLLHPLLHDTSEKVRLAFLELLLLVKGMRTLKFWHICPTEHILARMEVDGVHVVKRIVALLMDAFKPSSSQKIERCMTLLRLNPGAARRFYQLAGSNLPPGDVVRFILTIQTTLLQCIQEERKEAENPTSSDSDDEATSTSAISKGVWRKENPASDTPLSKTMQDQSECVEPLSLSDSELVCGLLEVMVVMWEVVKDSLDKKAHRKAKKKLMSSMDENLPILFNTFTEGPPRAVLYLLASHLPPNSVESIVNGSLQTLASCQHFTTSRTHDHASLLVALLSWERTRDIMKLMDQWLSPLLSTTDVIRGEDEESRENVKRKAKDFIYQNKRGAAAKNKATKRQAPPPDASLTQPTMALSMLSWMMGHPLCMQEIKKAKEFWDLSILLKNSMNIMEEHHFISSPQQSSSKPHQVPFDLLKKALNLHIRICIHKKADLGGKGGEEVWFVEEVTELLRWCDRVLVPALHYNSSSSSSAATRQSSRKRKVGQPHPPATPHLVTTQAVEVASDVLSLLSEMLLVGMIRASPLEKEIAHIASALAATDSGLSLLPPLSKLLYQLCEVSSYQELEGIQGGPGALSSTSTLLGALLSLVHRVSLEDEPAFTKAWVTLRQCVSGAIVASLRILSLAVTPHPLETYSTLAQTLIQAQVNHIQSNPGLQPPTGVEDMPIFARSVLKQACKNNQSTCLLARHLCNYLSDMESLDLSQRLLVHHSSLHLVQVLSKGMSSGGRGTDLELMRCVRCSMKMVEELSEEEQQRWSEPLSELRDLIEIIQERIHN